MTSDANKNKQEHLVEFRSNVLIFASVLTSIITQLLISTSPPFFLNNYATRTLYFLVLYYIVL